MEYIFFFLLMIILILLVLIILIGHLNKNLIKLYLGLIDELTEMKKSIIEHILIINTKEFMKVKIKDINKN